MKIFKRLELCAVSLVCCTAGLCAASGQTFENLVNFNGTNGYEPLNMTLVQGPDGNLYGTTSQGGVNGNVGPGTVFRMTPTGVLASIYSFCASGFPCTDGSYPEAGLVAASDGDFYGTTSGGGTNEQGTVFKITTQGVLTTLYNFCSVTGCADGGLPLASLIQGTDGNLYGTTFAGGNGSGTVFKITTTGNLTTLYSFCSESGCPGGPSPLIEATDGMFYGMTEFGGSNDEGIIYKLSPNGVLTTLYNFCPQRPCADGAEPKGGLLQVAGGYFYGTTFRGGTYNQGTVFKITPSGDLTTLYSFCPQSGCADGSNPTAALIQARDGNFYGTSSAGVILGQEQGYGTLFKITPDGALTNLHSFNYYGDGAGPTGGLMQDTNGDFYGATPIGGANLDGTVFGLSVGLGRFLKTLPAAGAVGTEVGILGTGLTGATSVTFNNTPAQFMARSSSLIVTHVPTGATTGRIKVMVASKTLSSNVPFYVLK